MLAKERILFLDCQTTGANPLKGELLEIAWGVADAQSPPHELSSFLIKQQEDRPLPYRIQTLTGIRQEDMERAVNSEFLSDWLMQSVHSLGDEPVCLVHFARFEQPFLEHLLSRDENSKLPFRLLCTYEIARRLYPNLPSKGIRAIAGYFGSTLGELKRASCHAQATWFIWNALIEPLRQSGVETMDELQTWLKLAQPQKRSRFEYPLPREKRLRLPDQPGIYRMLGKTGTILYVGKATSLRNRVNSYFRGQRGKDSKTKELLSQVWDLEYVACSTPLEAALLEADEIKKFDPPYNRMLKQGSRSLLFYSRDLLSSSGAQDDAHPLGPFTSPQMLQPLLKLNESLETSTFSQDIFFYRVPLSLLNEGFQLFCIHEGVEAADLINPRSLLALGLWLYRRQKAQEKLQAMTAESIQEAIEQDPLESVSQSNSLEPELTMVSTSTETGIDLLSAEEVAGKYERMLIRTARIYLRSKAMTKLLDTSVQYTHRDVAHTLKVIHGSIHSAEVPLTHATPAAWNSLPWEKLDISTYDRMSVLMSELAKTAAASHPS